jgi:hypothetical protein
MLDPEDEGTKSLRNIRNDLPNDTMSHPKCLSSSGNVHLMKLHLQWSCSGFNRKLENVTTSSSNK